MVTQTPYLTSHSERSHKTRCSMMATGIDAPNSASAACKRPANARVNSGRWQLSTLG